LTRRAGKESQKAMKRRKEGQKRVEAAEGKKKKDNVIEMSGVVVLHSRNVFKVELSNGVEVSCTLGGRLRKNQIKVLAGDSVTVEMSPFDLTRGRITFRSIDRSLLETEKEKKERLRAAKKEEAKSMKDGDGDGDNEE